MVGTPQSEDAVVWHTPSQPEWMTGASLSDDGRWVHASAFVHDLACLCVLQLVCYRGLFISDISEIIIA